MDSHKYLFSVIPNGDKYTSLVTGIITTVVKVSIQFAVVPNLLASNACWKSGISQP